MSTILLPAPCFKEPLVVPAIRPLTHGTFVSDSRLMLDVQMIKERLKMTKEVPLSQVVDWSLLREIKGRN